MRYLRVHWVHNHPDDPVELYSEIDEQGWEVRKVEVFPDGSRGFAGQDDHAGSTRLGETPLPSLEAIAKEPEFRPAQITPEEFERVWANRSSPAIGRA